MANSTEYSQPQRQDPTAFLMGGAVPSAAFLKIGAYAEGTISEPPTISQQRDMTTNEPKVWENGDPMMQLVVTLQTEERDAKIEDDDGRRRIYIKFNMKKAVADAVRKAGAKALEVGGHLKVTYTGDGEATRRGFNPPKFYSAVYVPPTANFLNKEDQNDGPQRVAVDEKFDLPAEWTLEDATTAVLEAGITRDAFHAHLRNKGLTSWNAKKHTQLARDFIAIEKTKTTAIDDEHIPFNPLPWIPA